MSGTAADSGCVFCGIVAGAPANVVFEDETTMAFLDIAPATDGHTLVIPKRHARDLLDVGIDDALAVMRSVHQVAALLQRKLSPAGLTVFQTNRAAGWQDVFHLHVHVVPRWNQDGLQRPWIPRQADPGDLEIIAARLRSPA